MPLWLKRDRGTNDVSSLLEGGIPNDNTVADEVVFALAPMWGEEVDLSIRYYGNVSNAQDFGENIPLVKNVTTGVDNGSSISQFPVTAEIATLVGFGGSRLDVGEHHFVRHEYQLVGAVPWSSNGSFVVGAAGVVLAGSSHEKTGRIAHTVYGHLPTNWGTMRRKLDSSFRKRFITEDVDVYNEYVANHRYYLDNVCKAQFDLESDREGCVSQYVAITSNAAPFIAVGSGIYDDALGQRVVLLPSDYREDPVITGGDYFCQMRVSAPFMKEGMSLIYSTAPMISFHYGREAEGANLASEAADRFRLFPQHLANGVHNWWERAMSFSAFGGLDVTDTTFCDMLQTLIDPFEPFAVRGSFVPQKWARNLTREGSTVSNLAQWNLVQDVNLKWFFGITSSHGDETQDHPYLLEHSERVSLNGDPINADGTTVDLSPTLSTLVRTSSLVNESKGIVNGQTFMDVWFSIGDRMKDALENALS
jgi:hypothetical protein